jgi:hypothetical protein
MLNVGEWLKTRNIENARRIYNTQLYPDLFRLGKYQRRVLTGIRENPIRANHYNSIQPTLKNTLQ